MAVALPRIELAMSLMIGPMLVVTVATASNLLHTTIRGYKKTIKGTMLKAFLQVMVL